MFPDVNHGSPLGPVWVCQRRMGGSLPSRQSGGVTRGGALHNYTITLLDGTDRTVETSHFETSGDFVDFFGWDAKGQSIKILRLRSNLVESIELQKD